MMFPAKISDQQSLLVYPKAVSKFVDVWEVHATSNLFQQTFGGSLSLQGKNPPAALPLCHCYPIGFPWPLEALSHRFFFHTSVSLHALYGLLSARD